MLAEFVNLAPVERVRLAGPFARWLREDRRQDTQYRNNQYPCRPDAWREYRVCKTVRMDPVENWIARRVHPHYLRQAIAAKAYGSPCGLIVYLNINEFGIRQAESEHAIEAANGCSRELSCSLALLLKPLPIVGASCGERRD